MAVKCPQCHFENSETARFLQQLRVRNSGDEIPKGCYHFWPVFSLMRVETSSPLTKEAWRATYRKLKSIKTKMKSGEKDEWRGNKMRVPRVFSSLLTSFLILALFNPVMAEFRRVHRFRNVQVPFDLKYQGEIFPKGQYDFEVIADRTLNMFKLRIAQKGKNLCLIDGEVLRSDAPGARGEKMEEVPDDPTLNMKRIPDKSIVDIIIETGKIIRLFPYHKFRFQMECE